MTISRTFSENKKGLIAGLAPHRLRAILADSGIPVGRQQEEIADFRFGQYLRGFPSRRKFTYDRLSE